jgi:ubiquinone/menaquinone biosynthesis C-methylase UbiE
MSDAEILAAKFSIIDAQRIVAREYGYSSWATLKEYVESLRSPLYRGVSDKQAYHQGIVESYDERSSRYDKHVWAREWSIQLVDFSPPKKGEKVLDIACGTGTIAFYIADMVGQEGFVTGIDISTGMIRRCNEKLRDTNYTHLSFQDGDAEDLDFPLNSFDRMYCSAGLYWMINPLAALRHWYELLKPGGELGFTAWPGNSFVWGDGERRALRKHGIEFTVHEFSGSKEKTRQLAELAGFMTVTLHEVKRGRWMKAEEVKGPFKPGGYTPGQYPDPRHDVPEETLRLAQQDFEAEVDELTTDKGVWHDMTTYFVFCRKLGSESIFS